MKKLMIAAAIVCTAVISQGAAIKWNSDPITLSDGTAAAKGNATGYLFAIEKSVYEGFLTDYGTDGKAMSDAIWAAYGAGITAEPPTYTAMKDTAKSGSANIDTGLDYAAGTYYAAIIYTDNKNPGNYMGNVATALVEGSADVDVTSLATLIGGAKVASAATAWSTAAIPEPTSGLLLLLGVAGLALRRRRA